MTKPIPRFLSAGLLLVLFFASCNKQTDRLDSPPARTFRTVPVDLARKVAGRLNRSSFYRSVSPAQAQIAARNSLLPEIKLSDPYTIYDKNDSPTLYVFNYDNNGGMAVISADFRYEPVCAYIPTGNFKPGTVIPSMLLNWFDVTVENIEEIREGLYDNTERANDLWYDLLAETDVLDDQVANKPYVPSQPSNPSGPGHPNPCGSYTSYVKGPLLPCTWGQGCSFNDLCPAVCASAPTCWYSDNAYTGCVATAVAQVLRYWQHPNMHNYSYNLMPAAYGNPHVQRMMYEVGVAVGMNYGCSGTGSSASAANIPAALTQQFNFSAATYANYQIGDYLTVKSDLNFNRPVLLGGASTMRHTGFLGLFVKYEDAHLWVCDGYYSSYNNCYGSLLFHMNWGWHEQYTSNDYIGYYAFNNWNVAGRNYQYAQHYVHNIHP